MIEPELTQTPARLTWVARLPFVRDPVFIRQMSLVFVLPLLVLGLLLLVLSGKPTYAGIGLMAQGPKSEQTTWKRVQKVLPDPDAKTITLRKGRTDLAVLYCTQENYDQALAWLQARVK